MKFEVNYYDPETGATSAIDTIEASADYTAEDYIRDCENNADSDWLDMIHSGTITLVAVEQASLDYALTFVPDAEALKAEGKTEEEVEKEVRSWIEYENLISDPDVIEETVQMVIDDVFFDERQAETEALKAEIKAHR